MPAVTGKKEDETPSQHLDRLLKEMQRLNDQIIQLVGQIQYLLEYHGPKSLHQKPMYKESELPF